MSSYVLYRNEQRSDCDQFLSSLVQKPKKTTLFNRLFLPTSDTKNETPFYYHPFSNKFSVFSAISGFQTEYPGQRYLMMDEYGHRYFRSVTFEIFYIAISVQIETSPLIFCTNQWTSFYMIENSVME